MSRGRHQVSQEVKLPPKSFSIGPSMWILNQKYTHCSTSDVFSHVNKGSSHVHIHGKRSACVNKPSSDQLSETDLSYHLCYDGVQQSHIQLWPVQRWAIKYMCQSTVDLHITSSSPTWPVRGFLVQPSLLLCTTVASSDNLSKGSLITAI